MGPLFVCICIVALFSIHHNYAPGRGASQQQTCWTVAVHGGMGLPLTALNCCFLLLTHTALTDMHFFGNCPHYSL